MNKNTNDIEYSSLLLQFIGVVENSRFYATKQKNALVELYWEIGKLLSEHSEYFNELEYDLLKICLDLKTKCPQLTLSIKNLQNTKRFYLRYYKCSKKIQKTVISLYWNYNLVLLNYNAPTNKITFYANQIRCNNWSCEKLKSALQNLEYNDLKSHSPKERSAKKRVKKRLSKKEKKEIKEARKQWEKEITNELRKNNYHYSNNRVYKGDRGPVWMVFNSNGRRRY